MSTLNYLISCIRCVGGGKKVQNGGTPGPGLGTTRLAASLQRSLADARVSAQARGQERGSAPFPPARAAFQPVHYGGEPS